MPNPDRQIVAFYNLENFFDTVDDPVKDGNDFLPGSNRSYSGKKYHGGYSDHLPVYVTMERTH